MSVPGDWMNRVWRVHTGNIRPWKGRGCWCVDEPATVTLQQGGGLIRFHFHEVSSLGQSSETEGAFTVAVSWGGGWDSEE